MRRVLVVGGGISGLTSAFTLHRRYGQQVDVALYEATDRVGGKLRTTDVGGRQVDDGADAFLIREPWARDLCDELGLTDALVAPSTGRAAIWHAGALRWIPPRQVLGVPFDLEGLEDTGLISADGLTRAALDLDMAPNAPVGDETVGSLVRRRLGDEVFENLTDPLLGGINAGSADALSLQAGVPRLAAAAGHEASLMRSLRAHLTENPPTPGAPVFNAHPDGMRAIVDGLRAELRGRIHLHQSVEGLRWTGDHWSVRSTTRYRADAIVLATPGYASAPLIEPICPDAAATLAAVDYASVVLVTFVYRPEDAGDFEGSGFLVPRNEGLLMTACSWTSRKWEHHAYADATVLRLSAGRFEDTRIDAMDDAGIVDQLRRELSWTTGIDAEPLATRVTRWPDALPQYRPGHLERMGAAEELLNRYAPGLFLAGAITRGLGIPACVHSGRVAARRTADHLGLVDAAG